MHAVFLVFYCFPFVKGIYFRFNKTPTKSKWQQPRSNNVYRIRMSCIGNNFKNVLRLCVGRGGSRVTQKEIFTFHISFVNNLHVIDDSTKSEVERDGIIRQILQI